MATSSRGSATDPNGISTGTRHGRCQTRTIGSGQTIRGTDSFGKQPRVGTSGIEEGGHGTGIGSTSIDCHSGSRNTGPGRNSSHDGTTTGARHGTTSIVVNLIVRVLCQGTTKGGPTQGQGGTIVGSKCLGGSQGGGPGLVGSTGHDESVEGGRRNGIPTRRGIETSLGELSTGGTGMERGSTTLGSTNRSFGYGPRKGCQGGPAQGGQGARYGDGSSTGSRRRSNPTRTTTTTSTTTARVGSYQESRRTGGASGSSANAAAAAAATTRRAS